MEWIETTAKTVDEARDLAIEKLGIDESEAELEILEEPKQGLFGRTRGQARVRARVSPKAPRSKDDRGDRRRNKKRRGGEQNKSSGNGSSADKSSVNQPSGNSPSENNPSDSKPSDSKPSDHAGKSKPPSEKARGSKKMDNASVEEVSSCVEDFLAGLTKAFDIETGISIEHDDDEVRAEIEGKHGLLLGPKARTLDAIQELTRVTASRAAPSSARIKVDVGGYREARREALSGFAIQAAERATAEGSEVVLEPMSSADRKIIHDTINEIDGVSTRSAGNDPRRRVVVVPDDGGDTGDESDGGDDSES